MKQANRFYMFLRRYARSVFDTECMHAYTTDCVYIISIKNNILKLCLK